MSQPAAAPTINASLHLHTAEDPRIEGHILTAFGGEVLVMELGGLSIFANREQLRQIARECLKLADTDSADLAGYAL